MIVASETSRNASINADVLTAIATDPLVGFKTSPQTVAQAMSELVANGLRNDSETADEDDLPEASGT